MISVFVSAQADSISFKSDTSKKAPVHLLMDSTIFIDTSGLPLDSTVVSDSLQNLIDDSLAKKEIFKTVVIDESKSGIIKKFTGKEDLFYFLIFLLMLFGLLRIAFAKYFNDLFRVFFRTTLKQNQMREQLLQSPLPSVLMNCFYVLSIGMYINFLLVNYELSLVDNFWLQYIYCMAAISFIYIVKFLGLKLTGWIFNMYEATESYIFIVFIINKMLGMMLLPFLVLLAFTSNPIFYNSMILSWFGIGLLLGYRTILSIGIARNEIKLKVFHFILYIFAFEVIPLLLIYKLLLIVF